MSSLPCQSRRHFLGDLAVAGLSYGTLSSLLAGCSSSTNHSPYDRCGQSQSPIGKPGLGMPGPFPGRVIEVGHAGAVSQGRRDPVVVRHMVEEGMARLVPEAESAIDAWRFFFQKGDRIGIKVVPVAMEIRPGANQKYDGPVVDLKRPGSISSYELIHAVTEGLVASGIRISDIMVFERYRDQFVTAGYREMLPDGAHWECASAFAGNVQLEIDGQKRGERRHRNVAGYDRDVFREMAYCLPPPAHDPTDDRRFRSHLTNILTKKVDKVICLPVLKDHRSAGITMALKNMSHGFVNNVARSHISRELNQCQTFIPAAVSLDPTRDKCVLQILDGLVATYEGGPGTWNPTFATWEYNSLLFATDPVAMDHVGWEILDAKRAQEGWPSVQKMGLDSVAKKPDDRSRVPSTEGFHMRQPQHVPLAATLGLGVFERNRIDHRRVTMA